MHFCFCGKHVHNHSKINKIYWDHSASVQHKTKKEFMCAPMDMVLILAKRVRVDKCHRHGSFCRCVSDNLCNERVLAPAPVWKKWPRGMLNHGPTTATVMGPQLQQSWAAGDARSSAPDVPSSSRRATCSSNLRRLHACMAKRITTRPICSESSRTM